MTIIEAIKQVMRANGPMSPQQAYDSIVRLQLYTFHAQRPVNIVRGEIRRHCKGIEFPSASDTKHFELCDDGRFSVLARPAGRPRGSRHRAMETSRSVTAILKTLKTLHREHRQATKARILSELRKLDPLVFERFAKRLLQAYGFVQMEVTQVSRDGGVDGHGKLKVGLAHLNVAFQCKRWQGTVGRPEVDRFRGAIQGQYEQGMFFTTSAFAQGAAQASFRPGAVPIILIDGDSIVELMIDKGFGVQTESLPVHSCALDLVLASDAEADQDSTE